MKTAALFILLSFTAMSVDAQSKVEEQVAATVKRFTTAMLDGDGSSLKELTHESLSYAHSNARLEDQTQFIDALVTGRNDFKRIDVSDQTIDIVNSTAVVRQKMTVEVVDNGKEATVHLAVLLVWIKAGKQWKLLARQAVRLQP